MSILNTAPHAVQGAASTARGSVINLGVQALRFLNTLRNEEYKLVGSALDRIGLQRRKSTLRPIAWVAAGIVIGGAAVFLLAPASVQRLQRRARRFLGAATSPEAAAPGAPDLNNVEKAAGDSPGAAIEATKPAAKPADANSGHGQ